MTLSSHITDLSAIFETVDHSLLLDTPSSQCSWLSSYFSGCSRSVSSASSILGHLPSHSPWASSSLPPASVTLHALRAPSSAPNPPLPFRLYTSTKQCVPNDFPWTAQRHLKLYMTMTKMIIHPPATPMGLPELPISMDDVHSL